MMFVYDHDGVLFTSATTDRHREYRTGRLPPPMCAIAVRKRYLAID
ncbi:hypothetical protein [Bifidobacterium ramosum]|nr:hypothetical protein [Bifidobacterium ramosum]